MLARASSVRSLLLLTVITVIAAFAVVRNLPESEAEPVVQVRAQEVQSIAFDGASLPVAALRSVLTTHTGELVSNARLAHDRAALATELATLGYLAAQVEAPVVTFGPSGGAYVTFQIDTGKLFHLRAVKVTGVTAHEAGVVTIAAGDEAIHDRIERARQTLADTLARRGKPISVGLELHTDIAAAVVDVELAAH